MSENNQDSYNHGGMIAFVFSMVFVFVFFFYIVFMYQGIDLNENLQIPGAATGGLAQAEVDVSKIEKPWETNADLVKHGQKLYAANCAMCHGAEGKGDGAAGAGLSPKPRNLVEGPWKKGGGFKGLYTALSEGIPGTSMVSFAHLKPTDRWALVQFIDSITKAKVKEDAGKVAEFAKSAK